MTYDELVELMTSITVAVILVLAACSTVLLVRIMIELARDCFRKRKQ